MHISQYITYVARLVVLYGLYQNNVVRCLHAAQLSTFQTVNYTSTFLVERGTPTEIETSLVGGLESRLVIKIKAATALRDGSLHVCECEVCFAIDCATACRDDVACDPTFFITIAPGVVVCDSGRLSRACTSFVNLQAT